MKTLLNYLLEANLGLLIFLLFYVLVLGSETNFKFKRIYLIGGVLASLLFPILKISLFNHNIPSIGNVLQPYVLPAAIVGDGSATEDTSFTLFTIANVILALYITGIVLFLTKLIVQFVQIQKLIRKYPGYIVDNNYRVIEINSTFPTFSFFRHIIIGGTNQLTHNEKEIILNHERVHVDKYHSVDILLTELLTVAFWFNPFLRIYKKILTNLHEFQADEKATEQHDVKQYCNLLARVALMSADFKLANHFNNSLTLKRITMMKTMKRKLNVWKVAGSIMIAGGFFFLAACQDQLIEATELAKSTTMAMDLPSDVQKRFDETKAANPDKKYSVIEPTTEEAMQKFNDMKSHYAEIVESNSSGTKRVFYIIEMNDQVKQIAENARSTDDVYTVVDQQPEFPGGMDEYYKYISKNIHYPLEARQKKEQGNILVEVIIQKDGALSDFKILKSVDQSLDNEALRLLKESPKWNPGKMNGVAVKTKLVIPLNFILETEYSQKTKQADEAKSQNGYVKESTVVGYVPDSK